MTLDTKFVKKAAIKIIGIAILLMLNIHLLKSTIVHFYDDLTSNDDRSNVSMYDNDINAGEYNRLRDSMLLFHSYDEIFDSYWEIADAYAHLSDYKVWYKASKELEDEKEEYKIRMNESKEKLLKICSSSTFEKNQMILESLTKQIELNE